MQLRVRIELRTFEGALEPLDLLARQRGARDLRQRRPRAMEPRIVAQSLAIFGFGGAQIADEL